MAKPRAPSPAPNPRNAYAYTTLLQIAGGASCAPVGKGVFTHIIQKSCVSEPTLNACFSNTLVFLLIICRVILCYPQLHSHLSTGIMRLPAPLKAVSSSLVRCDVLVTVVRTRGHASLTHLLLGTEVFQSFVHAQIEAKSAPTVDSARVGNALAR